jgi:hypothetical protein
MKMIALLCSLALAAPAAAQSFDVVLGGKVLGELVYNEIGSDATLVSTLGSTPMGVFNGIFSGSSTKDGRFTGESRSSRKQRVVTVDIAEGRAVAVNIVPENEITALSDITLVPAGVSDPVRTIGTFINAEGCPAPMRMYDGRRVVTLTPQSGVADATTLSCPISYKVTAGPGHLSPLGISTAKMELVYATGADTQSLREIRISSGLFRLSLVRRE